MQFVLKRLEYISELALQNEKLQQHLTNISNTAQALRLHEQNICRLLERDAEWAKRPLALRAGRKLVRYFCHELPFKFFGHRH